MRKMLQCAAVLLLHLTISLQLSTAHAQGTAFTYQGRLNSGGSPASGSYDLKFSLFATNTTGTAIAGPVTNTAMAVSNGLFTTTINFGAGVFLGSSNWLEIAVSTNGANSFTTLAPRQQLTPTPYAIYSATAGSAATATTATTANSANSVSAANISGTILNSSLPSSILTNGASGVNISGTFSGNGAGVTNVNVSSLVTMTNNVVVAWGNNGNGQTTIPANATNVIAIAAGGFHSLALRSDGTVVAWGYNGYGQTNVPANATNVIAVAAGEYHSLALRSDGTVVAWGANGSGQTTIPATATNVIAIAAGLQHSLALRSDGTVVAWGFNGSGQTTIPNGLNHVIALAPGCEANHVLVIQQQLNSPVAVTVIRLSEATIVKTY